MKERARLDEALVERGLVEALEVAARLVMAGRVRVDGQLAVKPAELISPASSIAIEDRPSFVSRGGEKLKAALDHFGIEVRGAICADVGASTGGFTDCLLQRGASRVYAIDSGRGQLHWRLRQDDRVVVMERTNVRHLESLPELVSVVTLDLSFISLEAVLSVVAGWLRPGGVGLALVKPQFEADPSEVEKGGVVRSHQVQRRVVGEAAQWALDAGLAPQDLLPSPLPGPKGNREYFLWLEKGGEPTAIAKVLEDRIPPDAT